MEKINIEYSKKSKRIDAKRLKDKMWEIILNNDTLVSLYRVSKVVLYVNLAWADQYCSQALYIV